MRVLHSACFVSGPQQILRQMAWEQRAANELGLHWHARMFCAAGTKGPAPVLVQSRRVDTEDVKRTGKPLAWIRLRREYVAWLARESENYDVLVLRYTTHDPFVAAFVRRCKKPVLFVHHAFAVEELALAGKPGTRLRVLAERLVGAVAGKGLTGLVGVTQEITEHEIRRIGNPRLAGYTYSNGIQYDDDQPVVDLRGEIPEFLFVAGPFSPWHGLDRLVEACRRTEARFLIHLVGPMSDADRRAAQQDPRFKLHGRLEPAQIEALSQRCWAGISSLAVDRSQMRQAATLKVREYLRAGLPVYAGYEDVFDRSFPYYREGPADMGAMLEFAGRFRETDKASIARAARPYIEKKQLVGQFHAFLQSLYAGKRASDLPVSSVAGCFTQAARKE